MLNVLIGSLLTIVMESQGYMQTAVTNETTHWMHPSDINIALRSIREYTHGSLSASSMAHFLSAMPEDMIGGMLSETAARRGGRSRLGDRTSQEHE